MKASVKFLILMLAMVFVAGCSLTKKMDETNRKIDDTNGKIDNTNAELTKTSDAIRLQKLAIAKQNLEDPQNGKYLDPFPTGLVGYAKTFAETGTEDELVGQIYLYVTEINNNAPTYKVDDTGKQIDLTPQDKVDLDHYKKQRLTAAKAICAFIPQAMMDEVVKTEIINQGRYKDTALTMLEFRFQFLGDILLDHSILDEGIHSVGGLEQALEYSNSMEVIAQYPFASEISDDIHGFFNTPPANDNLSMAAQNISDRLTVIQGQVEFNLPAQDLGEMSTDASQNEQLKAADQARLDKSNADLQKRLAFWQARAAQPQ